VKNPDLKEWRAASHPNGDSSALVSGESALAPVRPTYALPDDGIFSAEGRVGLKETNQGVV